jgi:hypothetical protein
MVGLQFEVRKRVPPLHNCTRRKLLSCGLPTAFELHSHLRQHLNLRAATEAKFQRACSIACAENYSIAGPSTAGGLHTRTRSLAKLCCQCFTHRRD